MVTVLGKLKRCQVGDRISTNTCDLADEWRMLAHPSLQVATNHILRNF
jgi:hypothetical protein